MPDLLYPRLPPAVARELFQEYHFLPPHLLREGAALQHQDAVFAAVGGAEVAEERLEGVGWQSRAAA